MGTFLLSAVGNDRLEFWRDADDPATKSRIGARTIDEPRWQALGALLPEDWSKQSEADLLKLGRALYNWADGPERWFRAFDESPDAIVLLIKCDEAAEASSPSRMLWAAPWELLADTSGFLVQKIDRPFSPVRWFEASRQARTTANRPLRLLFMASSPLNVQPVLDFEAEEAALLKGTQASEAELVVEETGSLEGLRWRLERADDYDVVHLTGHAQGSNGTPAFLAENETGDLHLAPAAELVKTFRNHWPPLVFLSGCETGLESASKPVRSLAEAVLRGGATAVLGWALPVYDFQATATAAQLYHALGTGEPLVVAVADARRALLELQEQFSRDGSRTTNWHLMRLYAAGRIGAPPMVTRPEADGRQAPSTGDAVREFLDARDGRGRPICKREDFVGRRRLLQHALGVFRRPPGQAGFVPGAVFHGIGGNGKSSLAARLADRLQPWERKVVYGRLDEDALCKALADFYGDASVNSILREAGLTLEQRLSQVFQRPPDAKRLLLILDDFEQNIPLVANLAILRCTPESASVFAALMNAVNKSPQTVRVIVTSRYDFERVGADRLERIPVGALEGTDFSKKVRKLEGWNRPDIDPKVRQRALKLSAGNPLLMEKLDLLFRADVATATDVLDRLERVEEQFRAEMLIGKLVELLSPHSQNLLAQLTVHQRPFDIEVAQETTADPATPQAIIDGVRLGLVETVESNASHAEYLIAALAEELLKSHATEEQLASAALRAAKARFERWKKLPISARGSWEADSLELWRLAIQAREANIATTVTQRLATYFYNTNREPVIKPLVQPVLELNRDWRLLRWLAVAERFMGNGDAARHCLDEADDLSVGIDINSPIEFQESRAVLLLECAGEDAGQGRTEKARERIRRAIELATSIGDDRLAARAAGRIADILQSRGELDEALRIRREEELPVYERLGDVRSRAVAQGQIADILEARGEWDEALRIRREEELPVYERLGDVRSRAVTQGRIADILQARGELDEALRIRREEQLPFCERLGEGRSLCVGKCNLALNLIERNRQEDVAEVVELLVSALAIADRLRIPEAGQIRSIMEELGMTPPPDPRPESPSE